MTMNVVTPASDTGGARLASFGSGDSAGRTQTSARGRAGAGAASGRQVSSLRGRINRANISQRKRRSLLNALDLQANPGTGRTRRRNLAAIDADLRDLLG